MPEADAIVNIENDEETVRMPPVDHIIGDDLLLDNETTNRGPFDMRMYGPILWF